MLMSHRTKGWMIAAMALAMAFMSVHAFGQGDFATAKGQNNRPGRNDAPLANNPGFANLTWWRPNAADLNGTGAVVDNPDPTTVITGTWFATNNVADEAFNPYFNPTDDPTLVPDYRYARTVAADS